MKSLAKVLAVVLLATFSCALYIFVTGQGIKPECATASCLIFFLATASEVIND